MKRRQKEILWGEDAFVAFSPSAKSKRLIAIFDARIPKLRQSGELEKLFRKWRVSFLPEPE